MRNYLVSVGSVFALALIFACSGGRGAGGEIVGQDEAPISELNCAYRAISSPNGATLASYDNSCLGTSQTSSNNTYGYANCTNAYIWEISQVNTGTPSDRKLVAYVQPSSMPTTSGACTGTSVTMYLYGLDTVNDIQYGFSSSINNVAGTWIVPGAPFSPYCSFSGNSISVDLDNWPNGADAAAVSVNGMRAVAEVWDGTSKQTVKVGVQPTDADFNASCLGLVTPPEL